MTQTPTETTFCSTQEASALLGITVEDLMAHVASGVIESWVSVDGRKLILRRSVQNLREASAGSTHALTQEWRTLRVCVIDSDDGMRTLYCNRFRQVGVTISLQVFASVFEALLWIGKTPPDLLLMDLEMPEVDVFALLQVLSSELSLDRLKIVLGTNLFLDQISSKLSLPVGVEIFNKPISFEVIEAIVERLAEQVSPVNFLGGAAA